MKKILPKILITGGAGFLGSRIVQELLCDETILETEKIVVFDIQDFKGNQDPQIEFIKGDIRNYALLEKLCQEIDIIIHCAAIIDWGTRTREEVLSVNLGGTQNVIKACKQFGIQSLVYTSSLDAIFSGKPLIDIDEQQPYPDTYHTVYCESKVLGELEVLNASSSNLKTCILRPSDIYGEADPYHMGALIEMAKNGFYVRLGDGSSKCQHVYVGNMAHAHVLAAKALWAKNKNVNKQIYLITDGQAENFFKFFDQIVIGAGYKIFPKNLWLPYWLAYSMGAISEFFALIWRPIKHYNPKFSRFAVVYTCQDFTFSSKKAIDELHFKPKYNRKQAVKNTSQFYSVKKE